MRLSGAADVCFQGRGRIQAVCTREPQPRGWCARPDAQARCRRRQQRRRCARRPVIERERVDKKLVLQFISTHPRTALLPSPAGACSGVARLRRHALALALGDGHKESIHREVGRRREDWACCRLTDLEAALHESCRLNITLIQHIGRVDSARCDKIHVVCSADSARRVCTRRVSGLRPRGKAHRGAAFRKRFSGVSGVQGVQGV